MRGLCFCFNPRTRVGCDQIMDDWVTYQDAFQSTHPRGVRRGRAARLPGRDLVSIHAPAWGATSAVAGHTASSRCFNPRTRVGCDVPMEEALEVARKVSIHAPAWGATSLSSFDGCAIRFQSTHPRGVRLHCSEPSCRFQVVSIHAPAWGATRGLPACGDPHGCFNPRTRVGCDIAFIMGLALINKFQSTHPRGVRRPKPGCGKTTVMCFNPRTRVGCDTCEDFTGCWVVCVSIHAPAWGATSCTSSKRSVRASFNPRTRVGCDFQ